MDGRALPKRTLRPQRQEARTRSLDERIATVNDIACAASLLNWDARTNMPPSGATARGKQIATLIVLAREVLCSDETLRALEDEEALVAPGADPLARARTAGVRAAIELHRRVPAAVIARRAELKTTSTAAWIEARAADDFTLFAPHLAQTVEAARDYAAALGGTEPSDPLIALHEPGETTASLRALFATLRAGLLPVLAAAIELQEPTPRPLSGIFPVDEQRALAMRFAACFGFDFARGRLDQSRHPFEAAFTREDVRITTRYREDDPTGALFGTFHETGHGLYEQNIDPAFTRTVLATDLATLYPMGGATSGVHESQSRLFENHIGRSRLFWRLHFGDLRQTFASRFEGMDADAFYRRVTRVGPSLIRTEADELTYDFHIMVRVELEAALLSGDLCIADLPTAWSESMRNGLGVEVSCDSQGCLQDIHWAVGEFGSFASYTIGNVMAAQLMEVAKREDSVGVGLTKGDYFPLGDWLRQHIWRYGRLHARDFLLEQATGRPLDAAPYLRYLKSKYVAEVGG